MTDFDFAAIALRTIRTEANGLAELEHAINAELGKSLTEACQIIRGISGRTIVTGMGKSGHVGNKLAATFASTGTPAFFVHPAEANHGDLGMVAKDDCIIAMSWSGEAAELKGILAYASRFQIPLIAITRNDKSTLGKEATLCLKLPKVEEACPNGLAPTTSTIMQMAIGDAIAVALLESRGFSADDFGIYHPGGSLGASLSRINEVMHTGDEIPLVTEDTLMPEAILTLSQKRFGCVAITDKEGKLAGILTDGDLARNIDKDLTGMKIGDLMTRNPKTISEDNLINSSLALMEEHKVSALIVTDDNKKPIGIVHLHDFLKIGAA